MGRENMNVVFVTGNENKAKMFSRLVGRNIDHHSAEVDEIQSLEVIEVAAHKAKQAFAQLKKPVLVEDSGVRIKALGRLPGPLIKWFVNEAGLEAICRLADTDEKRQAKAVDAFVYYDGESMKTFESGLDGHIANHPKGEGGWDWDKVFIPYDNHLTMAEMDPMEYERNHLRIKPMEELKEFLASLDKG
jgi:non-canonical purine NTP pyrophosphatase (RdgB/HAM1 family)